MKIVVNYDLCESNAVCVDLCEAVFSLDDDGVLVVDDAAVSEADVAALREAERLCPRAAIKLVDAAE
ncbi:MAG: ferredoxin [Myxococcales bacterium]|nr:ferredoxin [Myxococcales bacterium]